MTQKEIQERNKQIALMLGWKYKDKIWLKKHPVEKDRWMVASYTNNFLFHSDWNWLMEAVEFIESKGYEIGIFANRVEIITTIEEERLFKAGGKTKKEAVFIAVSDFAKNHNLYNKKP
jgi:hypothetical protein